MHFQHTILLPFLVVSALGCDPAELDIDVDAAGVIDAVATIDTIPQPDTPPGTHALQVTLIGTGSGRVTSNPAGIDCGSTCSAVFDDGTVVTLTAAPNGPDEFGGWVGACTGTGTCVVTMTAARNVSAMFNPPGEHTLSVTKQGAGAGTVTSSPTGINCGSTCSASFIEDTSVTLTATPTGNDRFAGWGGACTGIESCVVTMNAAKSVTATFSPPPEYTLTVSLAGAGDGTVTSSPPGIDCGSTCIADFVEDTVVTLTPTPAPPSRFGGWSGACSGRGACAVTMDAARAVTAGFDSPPNYVFVSSTTHTGDMGGITGADSICDNLAGDAGLPGSYRAWLSTDGVDAIDRFAGARGWIRPDGRAVVDTMGDLAAGNMYHPIRLDEHGNDVGNVTVRTATHPAGTKQTSGTFCGNWTDVTSAGTSSAGTAAGMSGLFTSLFNPDCGGEIHVYCFGIDANVQVTPEVASGRIAFVTPNAWTPGGGIGSADTVCQVHATNAGLSGTYLAALTPQGATAASRFNTAGAAWVRPDGVAITPTAAELFTLDYWDSAPNMTADGSDYLGNYGVWGGAATLMTTGTAASTCSNWASSASDQSADSGRAGFSYAISLFSMGSSTCNSSWLRLVCLQE